MRISSIGTVIKAAWQLGPIQVTLNALYRFGLVSGHYQRAIRPPRPVPGLALAPVLPNPEPETVRLALGRDGEHDLIEEADEISAGKFRQFGAQAVAIMLNPDVPPAHWTAFETGRVDLSSKVDDIKLIWEPARFGWAFVLGRAYHISQDEKYPAAFWQFFEKFNNANTPYMGPNWTSGQEVGLRLMAWVWAGQMFAGSRHSSQERMAALAEAAAAHAARIPATLLYARSQNNNHLLTEAAALFTAGLALPDHPQAMRWLETGRKWLAWCFNHQIETDGEYIQHSSNYQRLMLQTALWVNALSNPQQFPGGRTGREKLALSVRWLNARLDPLSGQLPNLGANDGALILPLSASAFNDYRPVVQAGARAFLPGICDLPAGRWDEMAVWLGLDLSDGKKPEARRSIGQIYAPNSWGSLRALNYRSRPSHADQLHFDLWRRGQNIALDAGTYRYNADPPWDNRLTSTLVHNTVSVDGKEQMTRAGRFLYLDWGQAAFIEPVTNGPVLCAQTSAYARMKIRHERAVSVAADETWLVQDRLFCGPGPSHTFRLHWLLPDWEWRLEQDDLRALLRLLSPQGWISLTISASRALTRVGLIRAGSLLQGDGLLSPEFGWVSPTYNVKKPALSLAVEVQSAADFIFESEFTFPKEEEMGRQTQ